ncbi:MAG TPA: CPCC family cysteine-rich protein [Ramlibacter sp.]|uniref:CPCC family cysteine-rich protein n=1 Tax=Ramlibacter sp. TaxID=1917967 RepID=UPI002ED260CD
MTAPRFTCPCCGYLTLGDWPGSYEICDVCSWEDDLVQLLDPWYGGGANRPCLVDAQSSFAGGSAIPESLKSVKGVQAGEGRDPQWRRVVAADRAFVRRLRDLNDEQFRDLGVLYYWRLNAV